MACESNAPANIISANNQDAAKCLNKCDLVFDYGNSTVVINNKGDHLELSYDTTGTVTYNAISVEVQVIRIYSPSLHTYSNEQVDAEMIIEHGGFGERLLVCIPIKTQSEGGGGGGTMLINDLIYGAASQIENEGDSYTNSTTWTLNTVMPNKTPVYSYTASNLPYQTCTQNEYHYLVWHPEDYHMTISQEVSDLLKGTSDTTGFITNHNIDSIQITPVFYNENGAKNSKYIGDEEEIYIECNPTGDEGEELYAKSTDTDESLLNVSDISYNDILKNKAMEIFLGFVAACIIGWAGSVFYTKVIKKYHTNGSGAGSGTGSGAGLGSGSSSGLGRSVSAGMGKNAGRTASAVAAVIESARK